MLVGWTLGRCGSLQGITIPCSCQPPPLSEHPLAPCAVGRVVQDCGWHRDTMTNVPGHLGQSWLVEPNLSTSLAHTLGQL